MSKTPLQTLINPTTDPTLTVYADNNQNVPAISGNTTVVITNTEQFVTNIYNLKAPVAGTEEEVQFNDGSGLAADSGLRYNAASDTLNVAGNVITGNIRTDNILYANGVPYSFSSSTYGNGNVASYLPTHTGNITGLNINATGNLGASGNLAVAGSTTVTGNVTSAHFVGNGSTLTNLTGANVTGTVATATTAGTVTTNAQPNITSVGTLNGLTVIGTLATGNIIPSANITYNLGSPTARFKDLYLAGNTIDLGGTLIQTTPNGTISLGNVTFSSSGTISGTSVAGQVSSSVLAGTVTANAQPNITSIGTLASLSVTGLSSFGNIMLGNLVASGAVAVNTLSASDVTTSMLTVNTSVGNFVVADDGALSLPGGAYNASHPSKIYADYGVTLLPTFSGANASLNGPALQVEYNDGLFVYPKTNDYSQTVNGVKTAVPLMITGTQHYIQESSNIAPGDVYIDGGHHENGMATSNVYIGNLWGGGHTFVKGYHFSPDGNLTLPTNTFSINYANGTQVSLGGSTAATVTANAQPNITSVGTLTNLSVTGNLTTGPITSSSSITGSTLTSNSWIYGTGNVEAGAYIVGQYVKASSDLYVYGKSHMGSVNNVQITGGTSGQFLSTDGAGNLSWATVSGGGGSSYGDSNVLSLLDTYSAGNINFGASTNVNFTGGAAFQTIYVSGNATMAGNIAVSGKSDLGAVGNVKITGGTSGQVLTTNGTGTLSWSSVTATTAATVTTAAQPNITSVGTLTSLSVTGNVAVGNINGANTVSANYFTGTLTTGAQPNITSVGSLTSLSVISNVVVGNVTASSSIKIGSNTIGNVAFLNQDGNASNVLYGNGVFAAAPSTPGFVMVTGDITASAYVRYQMTNTSTANTVVTLPNATGLTTGAWVEVRPKDTASGTFQNYMLQNGGGSAGIQGLSGPLTTNKTVVAVWGGSYWYYSNQ